MLCCSVLKCCADHYLTDIASVDVESLDVYLYPVEEVEAAHTQTGRITLQYYFINKIPERFPSPPLADLVGKLLEDSLCALCSLSPPSIFSDFDPTRSPCCNTYLG